MARFFTILLVVLVLLGLTGFVGYQQVSASQQRRLVDYFYMPPFELPAGVQPAPGAVVRIAPLRGTPDDIGAYRFVYLSNNIVNRLVPVSGIIYLPTATPPQGGWPVIALAHGTTGLDQACAPSLAPTNPIILPVFPADFQGGVVQQTYGLVRAGYAIVATDYEGLGVGGQTTYMVGPVESNNVLDSVRALRRTTLGPFSNKTVIWGHSQGGNSAAFASQLAPTYAPDVPIAGTILLAPAADLGGMLSGIWNANTPGPLTGLIVIVVSSWSRFYPGLNAATALTPDGLRALPSAAGACLLVALNLDKVPPRSIIGADLVNLPDWSVPTRTNSPSTALRPGPIFIGQGLADTIIAPPLTERFAAQLQAAGNQVTLKTYPGVDHTGIPVAALADEIAWLKTLR